MFIRPCYRKKNGKRHAYWALVESIRTAKGPRQRVVGYLGGLPEKVRRGVKRVAQGRLTDEEDVGLFPEVDDAQWVEVDVKKVRTENPRGFGGPWLGMQLVRKLKLDKFLTDVSVRGKESVPWELTSLILILCRLLNPSSELYIAEHFYRACAFPEILGVPAEQVDDHRLYRGLDWLLKKKDAFGRLLHSPLEHTQLEARGFVGSLHPSDGGGGSVPHPQVRPAIASRVAPEGRPCSRPYSRLLFSVCPVEDVGAIMRECRPWRRATPRAQGALCDPVGGRDSSDEEWPGDPGEVMVKCISRSTSVTGTRSYSSVDIHLGRRGRCQVTR